MGFDRFIITFPHILIHTLSLEKQPSTMFCLLLSLCRSPFVYWSKVSIKGNYWIVLGRNDDSFNNDPMCC